MTAMDPHGASASPSLVGAGEGAEAYELKFLLWAEQADEVEAWARARLLLDPHGDPALGGAYHTTTLYCDTAASHVYWRAPSYRKRKFRLRRYGSESLVYLERKTKRGERVAKRRGVAGLADLARLDRPPGPDDWPGDWFHRQLAARQLRPAALVAYERVALFGEVPAGGYRLTFDRRLRAASWRHWSLAGPDGAAFLGGHAIMEMKFRTALPALFRDLLGLFRLDPGAVSKYRLGLSACGGPEHTAPARPRAAGMVLGIDRVLPAGLER
jgi:hypothetical protein